MDQKNIKSLNYLANWINGLFPLYHGTDARIVEMSEAERASFKNDCKIASEYLWTFFEPYKQNKGCSLEDLKKPLNFDLDKNYHVWMNLCTALNTYDKHLQGDVQYKYDAFHLSKLLFKAKDYARSSFAFGEVGLVAYRMYDALRKIEFKNFNPGKNVSKAIDRIVKFAEDDANVDPVVFEIYKLDFNKMEIEIWDNIGNLLESHSSLEDMDLIIHYKGSVQLDISKAIHLRKNK